jgi:hypothetical protein
MSGMFNALVQGILSPRRTIYRGREQVLSRFESLGSNCEFGLAQRYSGLEPLGLFRFTSSQLPDLLRGLDTKFADYGSPGDLELFDGPEHHVFCRSKALNYTYNTLRLSAETDMEAALPQEYQKVAYLKTRFFEELSLGEKIYVRNGTYQAEEIRTLVRALRQHGPARLLWVNEASGDHVAGDVRWFEDGVVEGFMERHKLFDMAASVPLRDWIELCCNADALFGGGHEREFQVPEPADLSGGLPKEPTRHVVGHASNVVAGQEARQLTTGSMHTFSAWVWLPKDFSAARVGADFRPIRYGYQEADLSIRERWQLVWASCKPRKRDKEVEMFLLCEGGSGHAFWSADWRFEAGPLPSERPEPAPIRSEA